jgi:two-component system, chemotaxis family, sensor kinase CheA
MSSHVEKLSKFRKLFLEECADHLLTLETFFHSSNKSDDPAFLRQLDEAFRAIHSIKGGAGMFGLERLIPLAHAIESMLDEYRVSLVTIEQDERKLLLKATDCLSDLVDAAVTGIDLPQLYESSIVKAVEQSASNSHHFCSKFQSIDPVVEPKVFSTWHISFRPGSDLFKRGLEPLQIIRTLKSLGDVEVQVLTDAIPDFYTFDPANNYLEWQFVLKSHCSRNDIEAVFEFSAAPHELSITDLVDAKSDSSCLYPINTTTEEASTSVLQDTVVLQPSAGEVGNAKTRSIRVELERVDRLVNLAGEIAISQGFVAQHFDQTFMNSHPKLFYEISALLGLVQNLQDCVMSVRAQPLSSIFERMPRLVRELSEQLGKPLELVCRGETTEIDKSVLEQLVDPIVHLIRNAADHGIEPMAERTRVGKKTMGAISLAAQHVGSRVEIHVSDDGQGLDHDRIRAKAIEQKIVSADSQLSREEIEQLMFMPGFSTADAVTTVSGRGVGMDVVKKNIQQLGGKIKVVSKPGQGTTFVLSLPLSLAVLEGMVVRAAGEQFVIPTRNILECRGHWQAESRFVPTAGRIMTIRDQTVRIHSLASLFGKQSVADGNNVVIITRLPQDSLAAFVVDEIVGQQQVVVKQLATHVGKGDGLSGVSVLGDGSLALIVDLEEAANIGHAQQLHPDSSFRFSQSMPKAAAA